MIILDFKSSPDLDLVGLHTYYKNRLVLGRNRGDLLIDDNLSGPHLSFDLNEKGLFAQILDKSNVFHVNGKRIGGRKNIEPGDHIQIGETLFLVKNFFYDESYKTSYVIKQNLNILIQEESPLLSIIDQIDGYLKGEQR